MQAKLTPEQKLEIVEAVQTGTASMTELAQKYGVSSSTLSYNYFKSTKNKIKPRYFLSQTDKETIVREGQSGKHTIKDLASKYGVTPNVMPSRMLALPHFPCYEHYRAKLLCRGLAFKAD